MSHRSELIMALGKVLIAAAWADHDLSLEEVNSLKDLLFHLPELSAAEWAELEIYLDSPVQEAERNRLLHEMQTQIRSRADRELAMQALDEMVHADGALPESEREVFEQVKNFIEEADTGLVKALGGLMDGALGRRGQAAGGFPNREAYLEDFVRNKVYYTVQRRLHSEEEVDDLSLPDEVLRRLCLAGGLMARVAHVDEEIDDDELGAMVDALREDWDLGEDQAAFVAGVAATEIADELDGYRLSREFYEATNRKARLGFLEALFHVAAADGEASHEEIEDIRRIARTMKLTHSEFIEAKLTLPRDRRAT